MVRIICALRKSPSYDVDYVVRLAEDLGRYGLTLYCISDVELPPLPNLARIPAKTDWPSWWSKIEFFRPDIEGDLLTLDLDVVVVSDLTPLLDALKGQTKPIMLRDFYNPNRLASGVMFLPQEYRSQIWYTFYRDPQSIMDQYKVHGDGGFIFHKWGWMPDVWQDRFTGRMVSYKAHRVAQLGIPAGTWIVSYHGKPKPRDLNWRLTVEPGDWRDTPVFLLGGGFSLNPKEIPTMTKYGIVVGINKSALVTDHAHVLFSADMSFVRKFEDKVKQYQGMKIFAAPSDFWSTNSFDIGPFKTIERRDGFLLGDDPSVCYYAKNSGYGAFNWVIRRGARRIVLCAYDLLPGPSWHGGYTHGPSKFEKDYPTWARTFDDTDEWIKDHGIKVINASPHSIIEGFPRMSVKDAIKEITK